MPAGVVIRRILRLPARTRSIYLTIWNQICRARASDLTDFMREEVADVSEHRYLLQKEIVSHGQDSADCCFRCFDHDVSTRSTRNIQHHISAQCVSPNSPNEGSVSHPLSLSQYASVHVKNNTAETRQKQEKIPKPKPTHI